MSNVQTGCMSACEGFEALEERSEQLEAQLAAANARAGRLARVVRSIANAWADEGETKVEEHLALGYGSQIWTEYDEAWLALLPGDLGETEPTK